MTTGVDVSSGAQTAAPPANLQNKVNVPGSALIRRLLRDYVRGHWSTLAVAMALMVFTAGTNTALAWLLDPAVKLLFVQKDAHMLLVIPAAAFGVLCLRAASMYGQQTMMESLGERVVASVQRRRSVKRLSHQARGMRASLGNSRHAVGTSTRTLGTL